MATQLTQASENFGYSRVRLRRIVKLQFGIVNPSELVRCVSCSYLLLLLLSSSSMLGSSEEKKKKVTCQPNEYS
jgi:hypothetical protein